MRDRLQTLLPYLYKYRIRIAVGWLFIILGSATGLLPPLALKYAVDAMTHQLTARTLLLCAGLVLGAALLKALTSFAVRWIVISTSRFVEYDLRQHLFEHIIGLSASYFDRCMTGDLMARATSDMDAVRMMLSAGVLYAGSTLVSFVAVLAMLLSVDVPLTLVAMAPLPLISFFSWYFGRAIHQRHTRAQEAFADISTHVQENLSGVRVLRAYAQEAAELERFGEESRRYMQHNLGLARLRGLFYPLLEVLMGISTVAILWLGGQRVAAGGMTLGTYVAFTAMVSMLSWPMISLGWVVNLFQRGFASLERLNQILREVPEIQDIPTQAAAVLRGDLEFRNLTFGYNGTTVLHDISLRIQAGETVGIIGPTGAGKSTLVRLLPRLYEAPPGTVLIDGIPVHDHPLHSLRSQIAFVPQESLLFSDTLYDNVALGSTSSSAEQVEAAVQTSQLAADVDQFPSGLQTMVGERGITLSGGQRQRASLSRALLRGAPILVLDDSLSSVDTETEARILQGLADVMRGRTTLIISHRVSTIARADRILVLDRGRIVEEGTHHQLLRNRGLYAELHRRQQLEHQLDMEEVG